MIKNTLTVVFSKFSPNRSQKGVTNIEYGLIAVLITIIVIGTLIAMGGSLDTLFDKISNELGSGTDAVGG